ALLGIRRQDRAARPDERALLRRPDGARAGSCRPAQPATTNDALKDCLERGRVAFLERSQVRESPFVPFSEKHEVPAKRSVVPVGGDEFGPNRDGVLEESQCDGLGQLGGEWLLGPVEDLDECFV